jgi:hypothetical protein
MLENRADIVGETGAGCAPAGRRKRGPRPKPHLRTLESLDGRTVGARRAHELAVGFEAELGGTSGLRAFSRLPRLARKRGPNSIKWLSSDDCAGRSRDGCVTEDAGLALSAVRETSPIHPGGRKGPPSGRGTERQSRRLGRCPVGDPRITSANVDDLAPRFAFAVKGKGTLEPDRLADVDR